MKRDYESNQPEQNEPTPEHDGLLPEKNRTLSAVALESEPFIAFEQWMDTELSKLVARWQPYAAPIAARAKSWSRKRS